MQQTEILYVVPQESEDLSNIPRVIKIWSDMYFISYQICIFKHFNKIDIQNETKEKLFSYGQYSLTNITTY